MLKKKWMTILVMAICHFAHGQSDTLNLTDKQKDSIYIEQTENKKQPVKVLHAEPLYIDLIRDLGARKGEKEWNFGFGLTDNYMFDSYNFLVEYEFAPINRLGFEVELPFNFYSPQNGISKDSIPSSRLESFKTATQWTFFVSDAQAVSLAVGYINELLFIDFRNFGKPVFQGNVYNPFFVAAKRWGNNFHTLLYAGPRIEKLFTEQKAHTRYEINSNFHYMIPGTRNFVGIEANKHITGKDFDMTIRPQIRVGISDNFLVGIVSGIPINRENQRFSMFTRVIWEPRHK